MQAGGLQPQPFGRAEQLAVQADALEPVVQAEQVGEAHAAVHLGGGLGQIAAHLADVGLQQAHRQVGIGRALTQRMPGIPDEGARGFQRGRHLGTQVLDGLERCDHPAELLALAGIGHGLVEHALAGAQGVGGQHRPADGQHLAQHRRAGAGQAVGRHGGELQFTDVAAAVDGGQTHALQAGGIGGHQVQAALAVGHQIGVGLEVDDEQGAAREPAIAAVHRRRLAGGAAGGPGARQLGHRRADGRPAVGDARQPLGLLGRAAGGQQGRGHHGGAGAEGHRRHPPAQHLGHQAGFQRLQAHAAVLLGHQQAGHAQRGQAGHHIVGPGFAAIGEPAHTVQGRLVAQKAVDAVDQQRLFGRQAELHGSLLDGRQASLGSRGMPSPRSLMMFFWIWLVPPPMIRPR